MKKLIYFIGLTSSLFLIGCHRQPTTDFQHLNLPKTPSFFLACPDKFCNVSPNILSPVYSVSAADLYNHFNVMVSKYRNVNFVYEIPEQGQFGLVAYTTIFRIPNDVTVQFIALSDTTSTIAIYSRQRLGLYDFGDNQRLIESWLSELKNASQSSMPLSQ